MDVPFLADQQEFISTLVGTGYSLDGEKESGKSMLSAQLDDDGIGKLNCLNFSESCFYSLFTYSFWNHMNPSFPTRDE